MRQRRNRLNFMVKKRSSVYAPSSILGKIVSLWFLITISLVVLNKYTDINTGNDFGNLWMLSFLLLPFLGAIVAWKNSEPENDGFFSRFKSLYTKGLWCAVLSVIFFNIGAVYLESNNTSVWNSTSIIFFILSFLSFWISIGYNSTQTKYSYKRGFGDALAMTLGQILIVFFVILIIAAIFSRVSRR